MHKIIHKLLGKLSIVTAFVMAVMLTAVVGIGTYVLASGTSNFTQTINAGTLAVDIVNGSYVTVGSPTIAMTTATFSFSCQTKTGTLGTASEQIYVTNPDAAPTSWSLGLAAANTTDVWDSAGTDFDFNDPTGSGCTDGGDADSVGGQMTVDPTGATLAQGQSGNGTAGVTVGASAGSYNEGTTNSIVILQSDGTTDIGDWTLQGVSISQKIPAEQPAASDYDINMVLTVSGS